MAQINPCGLSYDRVVEIIKDKVLLGGYNGRTEVLKALLEDGFTYDEATQVTDYYYQIYNKLSANNRIKKPFVSLSSHEKLERKINNLAIDYLNGRIGAFKMDDVDFDHLQQIYEKEEKADTPTLKARYIDEANVFVQKFLPDYTDELFKSFVYAKPLLSSVFFIKSITSNYFSQIERTVFNSIWDGKKLDFNQLNKLNDLANASFFNVLKGGIPATTLYQSEAGFDPTRGRVEEYSIKGTAADKTAAKRFYFGTMRQLTKVSNRLNAAPDTRGIFHNAERHFYQLLKEQYRSEEGLSDKQATAKALEDMELTDINEAKRMATAKFKELGIKAFDDNGKETPEYKVAVAEYRRLHRDDVLWRKALQLSKNDFWKKNMMVPTELGFGDYGLFGLKAQVFSKLRDLLEQNTKSKLASAFNLTAFGFINGAANFAEDALERVPGYALIKLGFLQARKKNVSDYMLSNDIARRQKDIIAKNITTAMFFLMAKAAEQLICKGRSGKETAEQISSGRRQVGPCGIPFFVPPQMIATYKMYRAIDAAIDNDDEFFETALNVIPILVQANQIGLGGAMDRVTASSSNYAVAKAQGNDIRAREELDKGVGSVIRYGTELGNSYLPIPSRALSEVGTAVQRARGLRQRQQQLPFAIDESGKRLGMWRTLGKVGIASLGNVTGVTDIAIAALGSNKEYSVDWLGRRVMQFRGSDITGNGIQYKAADDILATAGVKTPYIYRLQKINTTKETEKYRILNTEITGKNTGQRYLTDEEFFNLSVAFGKFNSEFFEENQDELVEAVRENKEVAAKYMESIFRNAKEAGVKAVEAGNTSSDDIYDYITRTYKPKRGISVSKTTIEEQ